VVRITSYSSNILSSPMQVAVSLNGDGRDHSLR
jgi:hypothetical protein